jgi:uncharacterized protein
MVWRDLLFMHWRVRIDQLRPFVPPGLEIETFDGSAWLGIVPFEMRATRARGLPPIPGISRFPELNVRTYVQGSSGRPGVWFFSLDASQPLAVWTARKIYRLAYMNARMRIAPADTRWVRYESIRTGPWEELLYGETMARGVEFRAEYGPKGEIFVPRPGTLESFVTDRYCLYAWSVRRRRLYRGEIHHDPWPLQAAEAAVEVNTMPRQLGLELDQPAMLHYVREMKVRGWWESPE